MKKNVADAWMPGIRDNQRQAISEDLISDLEGRELSTNDYELLLQLDHAEKYPLQDYLLAHLAGTKTNAEEAKTHNDTQNPCLLCSQTLRMLAALRTLPCGVRSSENVLERQCANKPLHYHSTLFTKAAYRGQSCRKSIRAPILAVNVSCFQDFIV